MEPTKQPHGIAVLTVLFALTATGLVVRFLATNSPNHAPTVAVEISQTQNDGHPHRDLRADLESLNNQAWRELHKGNTDVAIGLFAAASKARPTPVVLSSRWIEPKSTTEREVEINLKIGSGYEIYSERKHQLHLPLRTELLDADMRLIDSTVKYPKPNGIPIVNLGIHYVYRDNVKLVASYAIDARPAYIRLFYMGSYRGHT